MGFLFKHKIRAESRPDFCLPYTTLPPTMRESPVFGFC
nr:MAG TPA: hypothetical protein [Caudoviricetes sp.]